MIAFACPSCGHQVSCPDHFAGKQGKCPRCRNSVSIPTAPQLPVIRQASLPAEPPALELVEAIDAEVLPAERRPIDVQIRPAAIACPFCAEPILPVAKKCKHCGELLDVALRAAEETRRLLELTAAQKPAVQHVHVVNNVESRSEAKASATAWADGGCGSGCGALILLALVIWMFSAMCAPDRRQPPPSPPPPTVQTSIKPFVPVPHPLPIPELPDRVSVCKRGIAATAALLTELGKARVEENTPETLAALRRRISDERERIDRDTNYARDRPELRAEVRLRQAAAQLVSASLDDVKQLRIVSKLDALVTEDLKAAAAEVTALETR